MENNRKEKERKKILEEIDQCIKSDTLPPKELVDSLKSQYELKKRDSKLVFRVQSQNIETIQHGLCARNPTATVDPARHVASGSDPELATNWISFTCSELWALYYHCKLVQNEGHKALVIMIVDLSKIIGDYEILEGSSIMEKGGAMHRNWSISAQEVLARGYVPPESIMGVIRFKLNDPIMKKILGIEISSFRAWLADLLQLNIDIKSFVSQYLSDLKGGKLIFEYGEEYNVTLSIGTRKIHTCDCRYATEEELFAVYAFNMGFKACKFCSPVCPRWNLKPISLRHLMDKPNRFLYPLPSADKSSPLDSSQHPLLNKTERPAAKPDSSVKPSPSLKKIELTVNNPIHDAIQTLDDRKLKELKEIIAQHRLFVSAAVGGRAGRTLVDIRNDVRIALNAKLEQI